MRYSRYRINIFIEIISAEIHNWRNNVRYIPMYLFITVLMTFTHSSIAYQDSINDIIERYVKSIDLLLDVSMEIEIESWSSNVEVADDRSLTLLRFRRHHNKTEWIGKVMSYNDENKELAYEVGEIIGESSRMRCYPFGQEKRARVFLPSQERQQLLLEQPNYGSLLWGRVFGNNHSSIAKLLQESKIQCKHIQLGESMCVLIEGSNQHGTTKLWLSPDKNYSALKWSIEKHANDNFDDNLLSDEGLTCWKVTFEADAFFQIDKNYVPKAGRGTLTVISIEGETVVANYVYRIHDVQLRPDFNSIQAFTLHSFNLPVDTIVRSEVTPGIDYKWNGTELVPIMDEFELGAIENIIAEIKEQSIFSPSNTIDSVRDQLQDDCINANRIVAVERPYHLSVYCFIIASFLIAATVIAAVLWHKRVKRNE